MTDEDASKKETAPAGGDSKADGPALEVIRLFGGIRPMAQKLDLAVSTVQGWRERGVIPESRHEAIVAAARAHDVELSADLLANAMSATADDGDDDEGGAAAADSPEKSDGKMAASGAAAATGSPSSDRRGARGSVPETGTPASAGAAPARTSSMAEVRAPAPPRESRIGGWIGGFLLGALVFAGGAILAVATREIWLPETERLFGVAEESGPAFALETDLAVLREQVVALQSAASAEAGSQALNGLESELAAFAERLVALESGAPAGPSDAAGLGALQAEITAQADRIAAVEDRLDRLAATGQDGGLGDGGAITEDSLAESLEGIESEIAELRQATEGEIVALQSGQDGLAARFESAQSALAELTELKSQVGEIAAARADLRQRVGGESALVLAALQLRDALRSSGPFSAELETLKSLAGTGAGIAPILAPLAGRAESGLPTLEELQARFPAAAAAAVAAARETEQQGWFSGVVEQLSDVVSVRRVGMVEGVDAEAVVARAEVKLMNRNLTGAVEELRALEGAPAEAMADWRRDAEARLSAGEALTALSQHIAALLKEAKG